MSGPMIWVEWPDDRVWVLPDMPPGLTAAIAELLDGYWQELNQEAE